MFLFLAVVFGPIVAGLALAIIICVFLLRGVPEIDTRLRLATIAAGGLPVVVLAGITTTHVVAPTAFHLDYGTTALLPLALTLISVILLMAPPRSRRATGTATLQRRRILSFATAGQITWLFALTAVIALVTIALGSESSKDDFGRYTRYRIAIGTSGGEASAGIYGWYYSTPSLIALAILLTVTGAVWWSIARRPWDDDAEQDAAIRRFRAANVFRVAAAGLLMHLAAVLQFASGTAKISASARSADLGLVTFESTFAAIGPMLSVLGMIAMTIGFALWLVAALSALPQRRATSPAVAPAQAGSRR